MASIEHVLETMKRLLVDFDHKKLSLRTLVGNLEDCLEELGEQDPDWGSKFVEQWDVLDQEQAIGSHQGWKTFPPEEKARIEDALKKIRGLIDDRRR